ncbi:hypothetical protein SARC_10490 [Sphaeroforma arctica JP610]|uniref:Uncharacterized protein n=1 Tax=Sphaeroforma arctica JP610 TaxID=667725 RepID=A0A0L0FJT6_9EUKA|nr:hypothetical protein SARC_10490 [Sphaeroforma arctica JP610]KNC77039.1 hypothetical protein SARC_10490 [Sphaeroforma arctica JP610]|eukprot:XP_014150941.1 hypothetical protein SARC_10490 [Sphaeroforma arctica JP610]
MSYDPSLLHLPRLWSTDRRIRLSIAVIGAKKVGKTSLIYNYVGYSGSRDSLKDSVSSLSSMHLNEAFVPWLGDCASESITLGELARNSSHSNHNHKTSVSNKNTGLYRYRSTGNDSKASETSSVNTNGSRSQASSGTGQSTFKYKETLEDVYQIKVKNQKERFKITITDTPGNPNVLALFFEEYLAKHFSFILVYSIVDEASIRFVEEWSQRIRKGRSNGGYLHECMVIGTKTDLIGTPMGGLQTSPNGVLS